MSDLNAILNQTRSRLNAATDENLKLGFVIDTLKEHQGQLLTKVNWLLTTLDNIETVIDAPLAPTDLDRIKYLVKEARKI